MVSRRQFIGQLGISAAFTSAYMVSANLGFARVRTNKRLVVVLLRGGMDSLAAFVPYGDKNYQNIRGDMALDKDALLKIDPFFALHPSLAPLAQMYKDGEMIVFPASASPYRERSHFDGQNILELGSKTAYGLNSGWLNRAIEQINIKNQLNDEQLGLAFAQALPSLLRGNVSVNSWAPSALPDTQDDYMSLIEKIYRHDPAFAKNYAKALQLQNMGMDDFGSAAEERAFARKSRSAQAFVTMAELAGKWLKKTDGPRIASLELGGWDTHVQQGGIGGKLANNFDQLARGMAALKAQLGAEWSHTTVLVLTEFGRTVRPNGSNGTDHGTASATFLCGGAVKGGRIIHDWPGLGESNLYQNRDLQPTIDIRSIVKSVLNEHCGLSYNVLNNQIYPGGQNTKTISGLIT